MTNYILKYDTEELDEFIVSDYKSKNISIFNLFNSLYNNNTYKDFFTIYSIQENDKLERLSLELYGTTNYWDIILMINQLNPLFDMFYDNDTIFDSVKENVNNYANNEYVNKPLGEPRTSELYQEFSEMMYNENDKKRYIYVIKPEKMNEFIKLMRDGDYI